MVSRTRMGWTFAVVISAAGFGCGPGVPGAPSGAGNADSVPVGANALDAAASVYKIYDLQGRQHTASGIPPVLTTELIGRLKVGMTYAETVRMIGQEPSSVRQEEQVFSDVRVMTAQWINGDLSQATVVFGDDKLYTIAYSPAP